MSCYTITKNKLCRHQGIYRISSVTINTLGRQAMTSQPIQGLETKTETFMGDPTAYLIAIWMSFTNYIMIKYLVRKCTSFSQKRSARTNTHQ